MCDLCPEIERRLVEHEEGTRRRNRDDYASILGDPPLTFAQIEIWEARREIILAALALHRAYDAVPEGARYTLDLTPLLESTARHRAAISRRAEEL